MRKQRKKEATNPTPQKEATQDNTATETKLAKFNYKNKKPVNGKLKGVVELGASGFNSFIIELDKDKNWEVKSKEFGNSLIAEGLTSPEEVNAKLKQYIQKIVEFGVAPDEIHFVVSSGAEKEDVTQTIKKELEKIGYVINIVTPEEEGKYALKSVLPKRFEQTGFVVDIGSGNTKISYINDDEIIGKETYGAKYFQKNINDSIVYKEVFNIIETVPERRRAQNFMIGGVPYELAKYLRQGDERYTVLDKDTKLYKEVVEKKGKKVASGLTIFKAVADASQTNTIIFDWDANFTIGFLLSLDY
ncbi:hypothetical protein P8625_03780 [Tenacibaculum tangerinum]|uniref:Ppx/GppA phosphatase domain-containing protein n=1 Tax=Tenacibaculum tangerinum TaxID=3038772 RepID=A0ABY8L8H2_9FLAO|nr:hypothetical protein [Tenacibaculum tangerinum]WGH76295.1 hypothetical protein P8625_03780 [Tenacibaculum tangerinum]